MGLYRICMLSFVFLAMSGCGTLFNLHVPKSNASFDNMDAYVAVSGGCFPFGGVFRSSYVAVSFPGCAIIEAVEGEIAFCKGDFDGGIGQMVGGVGMASFGLLAIADVPLSLAGDVVTLPIVYSRSQEKPSGSWSDEETNACLEEFSFANENDDEAGSARVTSTVPMKDDGE